MVVPKGIDESIESFCTKAKIFKNAKVNVIWVNSWFDPSKEGAAANTLMDNGADVVHITTDSAAATQAAAKRGLYAIGNDSDMTLYGPSAHLTAPIFNWGRYYSYAVKQVEEGTWKSSSDWWGMNTGIVDLAPFGKMVQTVPLVRDEREW